MAEVKRVLDNTALQRRVHHNLSRIHVPVKYRLGEHDPSPRTVRDPIEQLAKDRAGNRAEQVVSDALWDLVCRGIVVKYARSVHFDQQDRKGIDFHGELSAEYGSVSFVIDAKSSKEKLRKQQIKGTAKGKILIYTPKSEKIPEEANRLLGEIIRFFGRSIDKQARMV